MTIPTPEQHASASDDGEARAALAANDSLVVAELGRLALGASDISAFLFEATQVASEHLGADFVKVLELVPDGQGFLLTAGVGWQPGFVGQVVVPLIPESQAGYTMLHGEPVVVEDLPHETRFRGMPLLHEHGIISGISTVVGGRNGPHGIISVHTAQKRVFTAQEVAFLESVASVVGAALDRRDTESALRDADQRLRLAMEAGRMGTWEWDIASGSVHWSESLEKMHGLEPGTFGGDFEAYSADIHPDDREHVFATVQQSMESGAHELEYRIVRPDGDTRWLTARGSLVRDQQGNLARMIGVCMDITERKEAERLVAAQHAVTRILSTVPSVSDAVQEILDAICSELDWPMGGAWIVDDASGLLRCLDVCAAASTDFGERSREMTFEKGVGLPGRVWETGEPAWIEDVRNDPNFSRAEVARREGLVSAFAFAVTVADEVVAVIEFFAKEMRTPKVEFLAAMVAMGSQIGQFIERRRVEDDRDRLYTQLGTAEARYRNLFAGVQDSILVADPEGRYLDANPAASELLGYTRDELLGMTVADVVAEGAESAGIEYDRFVADKSWEGEIALKRKDGQEVLVEAKASVIELPGGPMYVSVVRDVTERRKAEEQVRETEERFSRAFHASPAGLSIVTSSERRFVDVNQSFLDIVGFTREEVVGRRVDEVGVWPTDEQREKMAVAINAGAGHARNIEVQLSTRGGGTRTVLGSAEVITLGGEECVLSLMYDITEQKEAAEQQQLLSDASAILASSLDYEHTLAEVARLITETIGDVCSVDMVEDGTVRRVALVINDPTKQAAFDEMPKTHTPAQGMEHPVMRVATTGEPELYGRLNEEEIQAAARDETHFEMMRALGMTSGIIVPLVAGGRKLGALTIVSTDSGRMYDEDHQEFAEELARRAGLAIDNALRYQAQQTARQAAEQAAARTQRLQTVTAALSESLTATEVAKVVIDAAMAIVGARSGIIVRIGPMDTKFDLVAAEGVTEDFLNSWEAFGENAPPQIAEAMRAGEVVFPESREELLRAFPGLASLYVAEGRSFGCIPLKIENNVIGGMVLTFDGPPPSEDRAFVTALSGQCAQALERARLFEAELRAREQAETAGKRQAFLAEASAVLASSLDYEVTLASVARLCVPFLSDWCSIDILEGDTLARVVVVHSDPEKVKYAEQLREKYPPDMASENMKRNLAGESIMYQDISDELLVSMIEDPELLRVIRELGLLSAMAVPLRARGRTFGILTLVTSESGRHFDKTDQALAEDLGHRAGLAVDNARLFAESQATQEDLRRANEAKDEFLGLVSHELRTPITTIYGGARLLRSRGDGLDAESRMGVLDDIEHESERLHRIVEDLLVLARVELGQEVITEPVLVQRVAEKTAAAFAKRRPGRTLEVNTDASLPAVRASNVYLEQILRNLINNADKYSPADKPIELSGQVSGDEVFLSVADRGPGIPDEEMELIFERFYRSEGTAKSAGGAGIGLTVCRRLIEAQEGRIWAEAREGGGLIISFSLPTYNDSDADDV